MAGAARSDRLKPLLWLLLAAPALPMVAAATVPGADFEELLHPSGEWSARLVIVALALTPLSMLFPTSGAVRWLLARRRAIGLAGFGYAMVHAVFYIAAMADLGDMLAELGATGIWTGWLALFLLLPPALASNDAAIRLLRSGWKRLQRLVYPAAVLTLIHWIAIHDGLTAALAHFVPLALLEIYRLTRGRRPAPANSRRPQ